MPPDGVWHAGSGPRARPHRTGNGKPGAADCEDEDADAVVVLGEWASGGASRGAIYPRCATTPSISGRAGVPSGGYIRLPGPSRIPSNRRAPLA